MSAKTIKDCVALIRSKNAGPFWMTIDVMMKDEATYQEVKASNVINAALIAKLYNKTLEEVIVVEHDKALTIKVSVPRTFSAGSPEDSDSHAAQQYAPLLELVVN